MNELKSTSFYQNQMEYMMDKGFRTNRIKFSSFLIALIKIYF